MSVAGKNTLKSVPMTSLDATEREVRIPRLHDRITEELVIALVGPLGSGCTTSFEILKEILQLEYSYTVHYQRLSQYIEEGADIVGEVIPSSLDASGRIDKLQTVGDKLREACGHSYLAAKAVENIAKQRYNTGVEKSKEGFSIPISLRHVHIIDSIKHPEELKLLRSTYGEIFWLIGVFAPRPVREQRLVSKQSLVMSQQNVDREGLNTIIQRDYREKDEHGQQVRDVFCQADFFVRNDQENKILLKKSLERFLEIIRGAHGAKRSATSPA